MCVYGSRAASAAGRTTCRSRKLGMVSGRARVSGTRHMMQNTYFDCMIIGLKVLILLIPLLSLTDAEGLSKEDVLLDRFRCVPTSRTGARHCAFGYRPGDEYWHVTHMNIKRSWSRIYAYIPITAQIFSPFLPGIFTSLAQPSPSSSTTPAFESPANKPC